MIDPFVVAEVDGVRVLAAPVIELAEYLAIPRWQRWTIYLTYALELAQRLTCECAC